MTDKVKRFFAEYEKAFRALEVEKQVPMMAEQFISAGPKGVIAHDRDEFGKMAKQAGDFYRKVGQTDAKIIDIKEEPISKEFSLVHIHWGVQFTKTGERWIEFDVSYVVQTTGPEPKIILFIAHEDEGKAMKELGVL